MELNMGLKMGPNILCCNQAGCILCCEQFLFMQSPRLRCRGVKAGLLQIDASMTFVVPEFQARKEHQLGMSTTLEGLAPQLESRKIPYFTDIAWKIYDLKFLLLDSSEPSAMSKSKALQSNLDVDYVISYRFAKTGMRHVKPLGSS
jgi:hypothetical protein